MSTSDRSTAAGTLRGGAGEERIAAAFADAAGSAALMPYLMGGYPDVETSRRLARAYVDGGADLVELGVPYSDPLADGPVIHAAGTAALDAGVTVDDVLRIGERLAVDVPVALMVYANLVMRPGFERFVGRLRDAGLSGLIVPDLPIGEESAEVVAACDAAGIAFVPLIAPTTSDERAAEVAAEARGFLYAVSVTGTTGERSALAEQFSDVVARAKAHATVPVGLGFGIATGEHAAQAAAAGADGVIVGSRLVRAAGEPDPVAAVAAVMADLSAGLGR
ncbi:Tryptophan synthase alpha chain [Patulibacter medicamentivorans]|uniref:Tryptophan synthase alpha chain n=1 Tax=Patulibacter medicamentivorans TaxID=1097667 RepID=H0E1V4_9ACTN|nr:tryptophan synthase subunit alpha [Patulibacter medicamentivorans]EHN12346.1 Tryptophan synthase alpha chain [Patulibacter medicamentivorans]